MRAALGVVEREGELVGVRVVVGVGVGVGVALPVSVAVEVAAAESVAVEVRVRVPVAVAVALALRVALALPVAVAVALALRVAAAEAVEEGVALLQRLAAAARVAVPVALPLRLELALAVAVPVAQPLRVAVDVRLAMLEALRASVAAPLPEALPRALPLSLALGLGEAVPPRTLTLPLPLVLALALSLPVPPSLGALGEAVERRESVGSGEGVRSGLSVPCAVALALALPLPLPRCRVGVAVALSVGAAGAVAVAQGLALLLASASVGVAERVPPGAGEAVSRAPREGEPEAVPPPPPPPPPPLLLASCVGAAEGDERAVEEALSLATRGVGVAKRVRCAVGVRAEVGLGVSSVLSVGKAEAVPPPADALAPAVALLAALPVPAAIGVSVWGADALRCALGVAVSPAPREAEALPVDPALLLWVGEVLLHALPVPRAGEDVPLAVPRPAGGVGVGVGVLPARREGEWEGLPLALEAAVGLPMEEEEAEGDALALASVEADCEWVAVPLALPPPPLLPVGCVLALPVACAGLGVGGAVAVGLLPVTSEAVGRAGLALPPSLGECVGEAVGASPVGVGRLAEADARGVAVGTLVAVPPSPEVRDPWLVSVACGGEREGEGELLLRGVVETVKEGEALGVGLRAGVCVGEAEGDCEPVPRKEGVGSAGDVLGCWGVGEGSPVALLPAPLPPGEAESGALAVGAAGVAVPLWREGVRDGVGLAKGALGEVRALLDGFTAVALATLRVMLGEEDTDPVPSNDCVALAQGEVVREAGAEAVPPGAPLPVPPAEALGAENEALPAAVPEPTGADALASSEPVVVAEGKGEMDRAVLAVAPLPVAPALLEVLGLGERVHPSRLRVSAGEGVASGVSEA